MTSPVTGNPYGVAESAAEGIWVCHRGLLSRSGDCSPAVRIRAERWVHFKVGDDRTNLRKEVDNINPRDVTTHFFLSHGMESFFIAPSVLSYLLLVFLSLSFFFHFLFSATYSWVVCLFIPDGLFCGIILFICANSFWKLILFIFLHHKFSCQRKTFLKVVS